MALFLGVEKGTSTGPSSTFWTNLVIVSCTSATVPRTLPDRHCPHNNLCAPCVVI